MTIHTFVDSSQEACGAACYVRHLYKDGTLTCLLVASKSHVAPLQAISVPRLELMAAVAGLKLAQTIRHAPVVQRLDNAIHLAPVVQRLDSAIQRISVNKTNHTIRWIVIYPVDSAIQPLNNRGQINRYPVDKC